MQLLQIKTVYLICHASELAEKMDPGLKKNKGRRHFDQRCKMFTPTKKGTRKNLL